MKTRKFTALLLVLCLLLTATPYSAPVHAVEEEHLAQEQTQTQEETQEQIFAEDFEVAVEPKDPEQLQAELDSLTYEVTRLREENVKHFHLSDGTYQAVVYGTPVHRKDANGNWVDIDNSLTDSGAMVVTNDARVKFAKKITGNGNVLTLHDGSYKITFGLNGAIKKTEAVYINNEDTDAENKTKLQKLTELNNLSATVIYEDILEGVDLEYVLISNSIKENIIVKSTSDEYSYTFSLELNGLRAELSNNAVYLYDKDTGELTYEIPQPYMYDAAGTTSTEVIYTLSDSGNGKYTLTIEADAGWINDEQRMLPVVIDPTLLDNGQVADTYVDSVYPSTNYGSEHDLWIKDSTIVYYKFATPTIPLGATVSYASLQVPYYYHVINNNALTLDVYQVKANWNEHSVTWNSQPSIGSTKLASSSAFADGAVEDNPGNCIFNVTGYVQSWYANTKNYGFALKRSGGNNLSVILMAREKIQLYAQLSVTYTGNQLGGGVYAIQKQGTQTYLKSSRNSLNPVTQETISSSTPPTTSSDLDNLFKITYRASNDDYVIRSMIDNAIVIYADITGMGISATSGTITDEQLISMYTWKLIPSSGSYYITRIIGSTIYYLRSTSSSTGNYLSLTTNSSDSGTKWYFNQYRGSTIEDVENVNAISSIVSGNVYVYDAYMRSTRIGHNGPVSYSVANPDRTETDKATIAFTGLFKALKPGQVRINVTYTGSPWIWYYIVTIEPAGCKPYNAIVSASDPEYELINCHGYAFWSTSRLPVDRWIPGYTQLANNCSDSNQYLSMVKTRLENNWLDKELGSRYWEDVTNNGGINADLADNQWLVAMRCGFHIVDGVAFYDYHFWYRTDTGEWANKHGYNSPSEALGTDLPTTANSIGWALPVYTIINGVVYQYEYPNFYDSTIVYYRITED